MSNESTPADDEPLFGDPIPEVFPPSDPTARFVIAMSMATNDLDRACRDLLASVEEDRQDFTYRLRLVAGHLVEAIAALDAYSREFSAVRTLLDRVPADAKKDLKIVRGTFQKAGPKVLPSMRDNTFHYPSPDKAYSPTSDEQLGVALAGMSNRGTEYHLDGDTKAITFTFADDAAINIAMGTATDDAEAIRRAEIARDGALAFLRWAPYLVRTYVDVMDHSLGEPRITEKRNRADSA